MAVREDDGGALGLQEVAQSIGLDLATQIDIIGVGVVLGITTGIGDGNDVTLPSDFWGQDVTLTLAASDSPSLTAVAQYSNTKSSKNTTVSSSPTGRLCRLSTPGWISADQTFIETNSTVALEASNNSSFGSAARSGTINLIGSSGTSLASISVSQAGNPAAINESVSNLSFTYDDTSETFTINPTSNIASVTVTASNSHLTVSKVGNTITVSRTVDYQKTARNYTLTLNATGTNPANTLSGTMAVSIDGYTRWDVRLDNLARFDGQSQDVSPVAGYLIISKHAGQSNDGCTLSIDYGDSVHTNWLTLGNTTLDNGGINTQTTLTWTQNSTSETREATLNVLDVESNATAEITISQGPAPFTAFSISPTSLVWAHDDTSAKYSSPSSDLSTRESISGHSNNWSHSWTNSSFVGIDTDIENTSYSSTNKTLYIKPNAANTSKTNSKSLSSEIAGTRYYYVGSKQFYENYNGTDWDQIYQRHINLNQTPAPTKMTVVHQGGSYGLSSLYPAAGGTGSGTRFRVFSDYNGTDLDILVFSMAGYGLFYPQLASCNNCCGNTNSAWPMTITNITWNQNYTSSGNYNNSIYPYMSGDIYICWTASHTGTLYSSDLFFRTSGTGSTTFNTQIGSTNIPYHDTNGTATSYNSSVITWWWKNQY
jgi:hypothetical protein